ncbi:MAG: glutamate racemase [Gammaproteobacteria bacterium RIFCSPHIGHO2_02_FULL_42_13]|nr:MAG: glutamate racemase [Gammaproteobacteria bacterium RIFCSPHIGHO2_02_FULL_42_13]OGT67595.1 MAG: glutamate racemase [Gammaproteobacteria bacterium RIFCSPLOWO2_02_FULL_42_9]
MIKLKSSQPIGIFDSGIGGLTVAKTVIELLPHENVIYFGDTAHFPYGDKSSSAIQEYTKHVVDKLLDCGCKVILIACNSASAAAYDFLKQHIDDRAYLINIIDPILQSIAKTHAHKKIGLIGTRQTIGSNVYGQKLRALNSDIQLQSLATPLLVSAIETMLHNKKVINEIVKEYLSNDILSDIDALILGCTHYPAIEKEIIEFYEGQTEIINPSHAAAAHIKQLLTEKNLLNPNGHGLEHVYVSDYMDSFANVIRLFFDKEIAIEY